VTPTPAPAPSPAVSDPPRAPSGPELMDQLGWEEVSPENLNFLKATGVDCLRVHVPRQLADGADHTEEFRRLRGVVEAHGLRLASLHASGLPKDKIVYGQEGREEQLEVWLAVLRAIGGAGVPITGLTFQPIGHFRTASTPGRGGAQYSTFDMEAYRRDPRQFAGDTRGAAAFQGRELSEEALWESARWFFTRVVPVAEAAGVRIALHPDDPPIPDPLGGAARIVTSIENYDRIYNLAPSPANAMLFCQGCVAEMGEDIYEAIAYAASAGRIAYVHFRDIRGTPYNFQEVFIDEGQNDMQRALETYRDHGFAGPFMMDHTPRLPQGFDHWHGHAYANGYIKALLKTVYR
jgi:mannonate dehydratase